MVEKGWNSSVQTPPSGNQLQCTFSKRLSWKGWEHQHCCLLKKISQWCRTAPDDAAQASNLQNTVAYNYGLEKVVPYFNRQCSFCKLLPDLNRRCLYVVHLFYLFLFCSSLRFSPILSQKNKTKKKKLIGLPCIQVCGSDGKLHPDKCHMLQTACRTCEDITVKHMSFCVDVV